jgi:hypothetical protein
MSAAEMKPRTGAASPSFKARTAGGFYLLAMLAGVFGEFYIRGRAGYLLGLVAVGCFAVVTLLFYGLFKPVSKGLSLLAACSNLVGLAFEALRWNPWHVDVAMIFHAAYCLLIGYLVFNLTFLPRVLGVLIAIAGLSWLTIFLPALARHVAPYNVVAGFLGEGSLMLWLLVMGLNVQRGNERASAAGEHQ